MILYQITNSTIQSGSSSELLYVVLGALIGSFISFFLFAAWDERKDSKSNETERARVLSLLAIESTENIIRAKEIKQILRKESAKMERGETAYLMALAHLSSDGWTIAKAGNPLKHIDQETLKKWILAYKSLVMINDNLEARELTKATSRGLNIRSELIQRYDRTISTAIDEYLQRVNEARETLPKEVRVHP